MPTVRFSALVFAGALTLVSVGCAQHTPPAPVQVATAPECPMPGGYDLRRAADRSLQTVRDCPYAFEEVFRGLINVAKHDPKADNLNVFLDFIDTLEQEKVIPFRETKRMFKRYFSKDLVALNSEYAVYAHREQVNTLLVALDAEMEQKRLGFVEVLGDVQGYQQLQRQAENFRRTFLTLNKTLP